MPNGRQRFPVQKPARSAYSARPADQSAILAKTLSTNGFRMPARNRDKPKNKPKNQVRWLEFQKD